MNECCWDLETHDLLILTNPDAELKVLKDNVWTETKDGLKHHFLTVNFNMFLKSKPCTCDPWLNMQLKVWLWATIICVT